MRSARGVMILTLICAVLGACGGAADHVAAGPPAERVCAADLRAAGKLISGARLRILDKDPTNIECLISKGKLRAETVAQANELAWTLYDTNQVHLIQAFGSGTVHVSGEMPHPVPGLGGNSFWVPAQSELIATNGSQSQGGSYVTVTVKSAPGRSALPLATVMARATLAVAPRGSNPPPPS